MSIPFSGKQLNMTERILDFIIVTLERIFFLSTLYRLQNFGCVCCP